MHDPKFENAVQKKLEELSFSPSEAVWTRVERAVNEKRRRRLPFFWFFLLPSLGLAGAGMIYFSKHLTAPTAQHTTAPAPAAVSGPASSPGSSPASSPGASPASSLESSSASSPESSPATPAPTVSQTAPERTPVVAAATSARTAASPARTRSSADPAGSSPAQIRSSPERTIPQDQNITSSSDPVTHQNVIHQDGARQDAIHEDAIQEDMTRQDVTLEDAARPDLASPRTPSHTALPGLKTFDHQFAAPTASRLAGTSAMAAAKTPINLKPKYTWEMGFAGGIGVSSMNSSLFRQPTVAATNAPALSAPMAVTASSYKAPVSGVQPDISFWAGIVAQRPLSKALTLSLGLDLHYYSTRQQIGDAVYYDPVSLYRASTLFTYQQTPYNSTQTGVYPYYSVGNMDVFVNRYYFLELPVSVLWKVNHSRNLPLFWENGFSLSYLVSTNSIYYNAKSGVFYKDQGNMANKTQLNLSTALLVGLPVKAMRLQVGPQVQYGLTSLQHQSSIGQHLFYGGIRIVLMPGKAKK